jgi:hypothetical protein
MGLARIVYLHLGLAKTIHAYVYMVHKRSFLAEKSPYIRPYTVYFYDSGQPYIYIYIYTVYDRVFSDFPAKKDRMYTVYIWFWPTLCICDVCLYCNVL